MMGQQYDELPPDEDSDPSQIYAAYQSGENAVNCDDYNPQLGQQQASQVWRSLGDILTTSPAICPACHTSGLGPNQSSPPDVQCPSCAWSLSSETLSIIDKEFLNHGLVDISLLEASHHSNHPSFYTMQSSTDTYTSHIVQRACWDYYHVLSCSMR